MIFLPLCPLPVSCFLASHLKGRGQEMGEDPLVTGLAVVAGPVDGR